MPADQLEITPDQHRCVLRLPWPIYVRVKAYADEWHMSYNVAVGVLLKQALDAIDTRKE